MKEKKGNFFKEKGIYILDIFAVILIVFTAVNIFALYYFYVFDPENHVSDIPAQIRSSLDYAGSADSKNALVNAAYSLNSLVIRALIGLFDSELSVVIWIFILLMATSAIIAYIAYRCFDRPGKKYIPLFGVLGLLPYFIGAIYIPGIYEHHYMGTMAATVWHNTTFNEMRLFGIITLLLFSKLMKDIRKNMQADDMFNNKIISRSWGGTWIAFVIMLFITVGFKTNFYISFCPVAGIVLIIYFVKSIINHNRTVIIQTLMTGISILAVIPVLYYQSSILFDSGEDANHIIISVGTVWLHNAPNVVLKPLLSILPFVSVLIYSIYKKNVSKEYMFLLTLWIVDVAVYIIFAESGSRMYHGNFGWGKSFSMFCLNACSAILYCKYVKNAIKDKDGEKRKLDRFLLVVIGIILLASIVSGIAFFYDLTWGGGNYNWI